MHCLPKLVSNKEISDQVNYEIVEIRKYQMRLQKRIEPMVVSAAAQVHYVKSSWFFSKNLNFFQDSKNWNWSTCICSDSLPLVKFLMCLTWKKRGNYELKCSQSWFYIIHWYFFTKVVLTYCEKILFKWSRKTFEIRGREFRPRIFKMFEIPRTIYSNSERSK